ncbi:MAG: hypothetical protein A2W90_11990 [Bacteroidetes bacterium GWF2_42_66]|nr:MAG: hypothetical protein A2W92_23435 [Bacteroidetes bacterium GWA2_42_15]OFX99913.1 MAG: hypothetical protein A2W89_16975 [Bacteroidetes bacterium GWE2_42_39]OFY40098.1 MAG: hypothetical protein A2W90_11990 [Bacteroidetes bacterium GWF2_42_66]
MSSYAAPTYIPVTGGGAGTTNLKLSQELSVTFDGAVTASATKYVRLYNDKGTVGVGDDVPLFVQPATDHEIIVSGSKVTFNFASYLVEGGSYYIAYDAGAFFVGGAAQPAVNQEVWLFDIGDWTPPKLATATPLTPADGSTNVAADVNFVVKFNEAVILGTPVSGNGSGFYLMKDNGTGYGDIVEVVLAANITGAGTTTLTINPAVNMAEKSNYYILIENGAVVDNSGNANKFAGFVDEGKAFADKTWGVSTKDMTAPVVTVTSVSATTTSVTVAVKSDDAGFVWVDYVADGAAGPASITTSGQKLTFTAAGTQEVTFSTMAGTPTEGAALKRDVWAGSQTNINKAGVAETPVNAAAVDAAAAKKLDVTLVDGVVPTLAAAFDPANGSTGIAKNKKLTLTFSEAVKLGTGNVVIKKTVDNSTWKTYSITDIAAIKDLVAGDKKKVEMTLPDNFASLVQYYVLVDAGAITDLAGNPYAGVPAALPQSWIFTVVDYEAPTFAVAPANGEAVKATVTTNITLTFNENIRHSSGNALVNAASVNANGLQEAFMLYENGTLQSTYTYTFNGTNAITIVPNAGALQKQKTYRLVFYAYWIEDMLGNTITSPIDITFTTKDEIAPSISAWGPATVDVSSNLTITLTEAVRMADDSEITNSNVANLIILRKWGGASFTTVGSADYSVSIDAAKKVITVDPVADLPSGGQYRLTISPNIEDLSGNALTNVTQLGAAFGAATSGTDREKDYTVKDYVAPVVTLAPANGASVAASTTIVVTVSEAVTLLTGAPVNQSIITLREGGINGTDIVLPAPAVAGNVYTFTPAPALNAGKTYYLAVDATLKDVSGNVNTKVTSTFTTQGNTPPNAIAGTIYSPAAASKLNAKNSVITVTFTEGVKLVAGQEAAATVNVDGGADLNTTAATLSADGKVLTIPHANFTATAAGTPVNNNVVVNIPIGMLTAGDGTTAMTAAITWSFGSQDETAPVPTYTPALAATPAGIALNVTPKINFNEEVKILPTAYVEIRDVATDYLVQTITGSSNLSLKSVGGTNNELNIKLLGNLTYGKSYYIFIPPNVITDTSDNNYAGVVNKPSDGVNVAWDFDVLANPGALVVNEDKSVPAVFTDNVALDANLVVDFSNPLNSGSIDNNKNWVLLELTGFTSTTGTVAGIAAVADQSSVIDASTTYSGNKVTIDPDLNLKANKWYILRFENGFIKDIYGTALTGSSTGPGAAAGQLTYAGLNPNDIVFHTGSAQGPIASIQPAHKQENVAKNSNIVITFNEPFFKAGGAAAVTVADLEAWPSAYITVSSNNTGAIAYNATISGSSISIDPVADFGILDNERVTVTVLAGKFYDAANNTYDALMGSGAIGSPADDQVFYFDPIDQTGPIAAVSGLASAKGTELTYKVTSNELGFVYSLAQLTTAAAPSAATIKANGTVTEIKATATPTPSTAIKVEGLTPGTSYTVYVVGIDAVATPNTGAVASAAVTTPDDVAPTFVKALPASPVATATPTISFEYNENLAAAAAGLAVVREKSTQDIVAVWNIAALAGTSDVGVTSVKKVTLNLADAMAGSVAAFTSETTYEVRLDPQSVQDLAAPANKNADPVVYEFTIKDLVVPTITATSPAKSAVGAAPTHSGQNVSITFSENMTPTATVIRVYEDRGAGFAGSIVPNNEIETIDPNTVTWSADHKKATFSVSHFLLKAVTEYYIVVADACFKDDGSNNPSWAAFLGANVFQFKTSDQTTLTATHTFAPAPLVANTNVNPTAVITINIVGEDVVWTKHPFKQYIVPANADSILSIYDASGVELTSAKVTLNAIDTDASGGIDRFTITPITKLTDNSSYTVKFNDIEDINGNDVVDHVAAGTQFTFTTGDGTAPKITFNPANKSVETSENGPFVMTFDEPLYAFTGVIGSAAQVIDNNLVASYVELYNVTTTASIPFNATIAADYKTITITPQAAIAQPNVAATVVRYGFNTAKAVGDYYGNQIAAGSTQNIVGTATASATTFAETTIRDYKAPKVIVAGYTPIGATTATKAMTVQFDEDIAKGSGNLYIRELETGTIIETVPASAVTVTLNHTTLGDYITVPHAAFAMNTKFYVTIDEGFVTDVSTSKNKFAGISDATSTLGKTWTFNTADINGPAVKSMSPAPLSAEVLLEEKLKLIFDQPVQAGVGNIVIYEADGTPYDIIPVPSANVDFNAQYAAGGGDTIVTVSHLKFQDASTYFVRIAKGAIDDKSGNDYAGIADRTWTFTTEDYTPATYTIVTPLDDATTVGLMPTFELKFNRAIQAGTGKIQLWKRSGEVKLQEINGTAATIAADGKSATFTFPTKLPEATDLYVIVNSNAFVNASVSHVPFIGITEQWTWNFTTGTDAIAPTLVSVSPDAATGLKPADVKLELTLSEDVAAGTGNIVIYNAATDALVKSTPITDPSVTIAGAKVTVTLAAGTLAEQTSYYVLVDAGAIKDKAVTPNSFAGITDKTRWTFATGDFTAPTKVSVEPNATTITFNHPILVLTMNEPVKLTAAGGSVTITKVGTTTTPVTIPLTAAMISADGKVITMTYVAAGAVGLDKNTDYFVTVPAGALEDNAGNDFAGITTATAWTFKTGTSFATGNDPVLGSLEFKVYPNPFVNELKVDNASELSRIIITSMTGQKVKEIVNPTSTIQTNELRSGVYFISLYVDDVVAKTERIVKR